jgi:hypothetical protein
MAKTFHSEEPRPGIIHLIDERGQSRLLITYCPDCGITQSDEFDYLVRDLVWKHYVPLGGVLCCYCLSKRMRGPEGYMRASDFEPGFAPGQMLLRHKIAQTAACICSHSPTEYGPCRCRVALYQKMLLLDKKNALADWEVRTAFRLAGDHHRYRE